MKIKEYEINDPLTFFALSKPNKNFLKVTVKNKWPKSLEIPSTI